MRCACPWCPEPTEDGCVALFSGEPTCREHDYRTTCRDLVDSIRILNENADKVNDDQK